MKALNSSTPEKRAMKRLSDMLRKSCERFVGAPVTQEGLDKIQRVIADTLKKLSSGDVQTVEDPQGDQDETPKCKTT